MYNKWSFEWKFKALTFILEWNFQMRHAFFKEKGKSEYKEKMIHKFHTIKLSFLEVQSLVYNELNNTQKLLCSLYF